MRANRVRLTADREERVGLLPLDCGHAFQSAEPSSADVDSALHLRLPKQGAEERDGDYVVLFLGGVHLLRTPEGKRSHTVDKRLTGLLDYPSRVPHRDLFHKTPQDRHSFAGFESTLVELNNLLSYLAHSCSHILKFQSSASS